MMHIIIQRTLLSFILLLVFLLAVKCYSAYNEWKVRSRSRKKQLPSNIETGKPVLLYFWTSHCAQCKPQERQIERAQAVLQQSGRTLKVQKLNALEEQALAKLMHVMTVPTTVLLNSQGDVSTWNPGLTYANTIIRQYLAVR
jgi:thiol-disulfide isomerase/thioredoxin